MAVVLLLTGAPTSQTVGKIEVSYTFEYIPVEDYLPFCNLL